ncbi:queuosine biosynthesis QueD, PTPS-I [Cellulophaga phage phi47:1]|uniref:QueD-like 6-pyruvoyl-tetrahydropterin synthase n=1 Tax=Cellulophaga phage phiSM TaxID=756280 RepID=UPI0002B78DBC|nr:QueD-like 6-pyruvoyl-tetrahydropterin synthase [Cellulophaga phage phiSM]AGF91621.1 6-pyruvoyl-tetrahydropterin synthase [Cellulophaga phage phi47:1]AGO47780.1 queuosine biosynthesis QueD, PTPS-I [Cellulophaga phage phi3ST:2]AGO49288.1 queuosine biosynthesis QueD, PTPS-I [Cellulophaga phage phi38:2]AGO49368.1 queuosine biosynthesis QueD, PTPS-I [Cellulophaga phage phi3:1]AGH07798.1 6-pyruvoyl-tetrahydropterin synthase [Cellulophaga phage phiSM]
MDRGLYQSTKVIDGFSACFRQFRAESHCRLLHGYSLKFKVTFESSTLDANNWVMDFGFLKTKVPNMIDETGSWTIRDWFSYMFDHTTIVAIDDPSRQALQELDREALDLRILERVGCEYFAEFVWHFLNNKLGYISKNNDAKILCVECIENEKNSAIYYGKGR